MVTVRPSSSVLARAFATRPSAILALHLACPVCAASASIPAMRAPSHTPAGRCHHLVPGRRAPGPAAQRQSVGARRSLSEGGGWSSTCRSPLSPPYPDAKLRPAVIGHTDGNGGGVTVRAFGRSIRWRGGASVQSTTNPSRRMNRRHCRRYHYRGPHRFRLLGRMTWDGRSPAKPSPCGLFPRPPRRAPRGRCALK